jgi:hypothetical protein
MALLYIVHGGDKLEISSPVYAVHTELTLAKQVKLAICEAKITELDFDQIAQKFINKDTQNGPQNF